jgi:ribosomal protein S18 acetylase RimI-like enzyme
LNPVIVAVRPFRIEDVDLAARFCEAARARDPAIEPFSQRLSVIATGTRAVLPLWRVAAGEDGELHGIAFAAMRESAARPTFDFYAAVDPALRRQGLGRALAEPALACGAVLRTRVRDDSEPGRAFLNVLGFIETGAQLSLHWNGKAKTEPPPMPALRIRSATATRDQGVLQRLSIEAWAGAPDTFASRADEIAQLFGDDGRVALIAESEGNVLGYLAGVQLGRTLGIEEVAVLPDFRRMGIGRALVARALRNEQGAVLSVSEANKPARALYKSLGFGQTARRIVLERRPSGGQR